MRASADVDLPWFWGTGPASAIGEAGMRSPFGSQLDAARSGIDRDRVAVDSSRSEDEMFTRLLVAHRYQLIEARLRAISVQDRAALHAHYAERPLRYGLSAAACIVAGKGRDELQAALGQGDVGRAMAAQLEPKALAIVAQARIAYASATVPTSRRPRT